jgi:hypothetical protein
VDISTDYDLFIALGSRARAAEMTRRGNLKEFVSVKKVYAMNGRIGKWGWANL